MLHEQPMLVSVLELTNAANCPAIEQFDLVLRYAENDDVFCDDFLRGVIIHVPSNHDEQGLARDARGLLNDRGNVWVDIRPRSESSLIQGTYVVQDSLLRRVYRLYDDQQTAFLTTLKPKGLRG
jgi:hypothetical protein